MSRFLFALCLLAVPGWGASPDLDQILKGVEKRYNNARTLQVFFEQTYDAPRRREKTETGELVLRKPGRMRWEYSSPKGKLFITDGQMAWLYLPASNRVERSKVKETEDLRAPLAFLLGRVDFRRDFARFIVRPKPDGVWITAEPKSDRVMFQKIEFRVTPDYAIQDLIITDHANTVMSFRFASEKLNVPVSESSFTFTPPPGAEVMDAVQ